MKILNLMIAFFAVLLTTFSTVHGQEFYQGQTIQIVVGFAAGGGFDTYSRAIARHLGRNIPGNPNIIVMNTPGAGSLIAANQLYKAKPDGLVIGNFVERRGDSGSWAYGR